MLKDVRDDFRQYIEEMRAVVERLRAAVAQRSNAIRPNDRRLVLAWANELEAELDAQEMADFVEKFNAVIDMP
jgi:hypothetical protein